MTSGVIKAMNTNEMTTKICEPKRYDIQTIK